MKMARNLQGEIGSEISTIENIERSAAALDVRDLEQSRRRDLHPGEHKYGLYSAQPERSKSGPDDVEERSRSRHSR